MVCQQQFPVQPKDLDQNGQLKPSSLLFYAQEVAGAHAQKLGSGWETLRQKGLFWAVIRTRVQIFAQPRCGEQVTVKTWPMPTSRTAYPRCVMGYNEEGALLFKVLSLWVLMDVKTRTMVLPGKSGVEVPGTVLGGEPETPRGLPSQESAAVVERTVEQQLLDRNGHMNNTRYMDWVMELKTNDRPVKGFELCYFNEGRLGDRMELGYVENTDSLFVDIHRQKTDASEKKDRIFAASVIF